MKNILCRCIGKEQQTLILIGAHSLEPLPRSCKSTEALSAMQLRLNNRVHAGASGARPPREPRRCMAA